MKKLLIIILAFISYGLYAQVDTVSRGTGPDSGTGETLWDAFGKVNLAIEQVNKNTDSITVIQEDTVDIDDVALQLYQYALELPDSTADSTVNYVTHTQLTTTNDADSFLYKSDQILALRQLGSNIKAQTLTCRINEASVDNQDFGDGTGRYVAIYIREADSITGAYFVSAENGSFNQADFNGIALYKYGSDDTLRQVAISANDSTKWETATSTLITFPFTGKYYAEPGLYYLGVLANWTGTPSAIPEITISATHGTTVNRMYKLTFYRTSETAFETKFKLNTGTNVNNTYTLWGALY